MAKKEDHGSNGNGGGVQDAMLDVLKAIHESVETSRVELRGELQDLRTELRGELKQLRDETRAGFADVRGELHEVRGRLENIRDLAGDLYRALEQRVTRLEAQGTR